IFGGTLADRYGTKKIFVVAVFMDTIGNLSTPFLSKLPNAMYLIIIMRTLMGIFQGGCYPSLHSLISKWIPKDEVSRYMSFVYA
ncbi:putative anion transporter 4, chloroplastic, partial [Armadillidium vulgare]